MIDQPIQPWQELHPEFKLNGVPIALEALEDVAYSLTKEGEEFERVYGEFLLDWLDQSGYIEVQTSGSTGSPRIWKMKKRDFLASAKLTGEVFDLFPGKRTLLGIPGSFIAGKMMFVRAMVLGLDLLVVKPSKNTLEEVGGRFYFVAMTPYQLANSLGDLDRVDTVLVGGAPFPASLEAALEGYKCRVVESYGMTETLTHVALREVHPHKQDSFHALPGVTFNVDDRGCLLIEAEHLAIEALQTEDLVELLDEGSFVWKGRLDRVINTGGIKVFPEQIEAKLEAFIPHRFFIGAQLHPELGEQVVLFIEQEKEDAEVLHSLQSNSELSTGEKPREIHWFKSFKELHSGKIDRLGTLESEASHISTLKYNF